MPQPIGDDKVLPASEGHVLLFTTAPKGWIARKQKTDTSAQHPGTAVLWEGELWEVLEIDTIRGLGVQYRLAPWEEQHAIRTATSYSEQAEAARYERDASDSHASKTRLTMTLLAPVTGLLPGHVQERYSKLYGTPRLGLTYVSLILPFILGALSFMGILIMTAGALLSPGSGGGNPLPLLVGSYFLVESLIRFVLAMSDSRPSGSAIAVVPYWFLMRLTGQIPDREVQDPENVAPEEDRYRLQDRFSMLEPLLSLLTTEEQKILERKFAFQSIRWGTRTSLVILSLMLAQVLNSVDILARGPTGSTHALIALGLAIGIGTEQVIRLLKLRKGRIAGSVLGHLVRPLAKSLFVSS